METIFQSFCYLWVRICLKLLVYKIINANFFFLGEQNHFNINLEDEVVRGSMILDKGKMMWPPPPLKIMPPQVVPKKPADIAKAAAKEIDPFKATLNTALTTTAG